MALGFLHFLRILNGRVAVAKDAALWQSDAWPWQIQALNKLDAESRKLRALESLRALSSVLAALGTLQPRTLSAL